MKAMCAFCFYYDPIRNIDLLPEWARIEHLKEDYDMADKTWGNCIRNAPVAAPDKQPVWPVVWYEDGCGAGVERQRLKQPW